MMLFWVNFCWCQHKSAVCIYK